MKHKGIKLTKQNRDNVMDQAKLFQEGKKFIVIIPKKVGGVKYNSRKEFDTENEAMKYLKQGKR